MFKKIPLLWFFASLFYLLIEVTFRSDLITLAATSADQSQMADLERLGRFIASLGFAIFIASLLRKKNYDDISFKYRRRLMLASFFISFFAFSWSQQTFINYIASNISDRDKREILLSNLYRDVNYLVGVKNNGNSTNWLNSSSKTTLALTPLMSFTNPKLEYLAADFREFAANSEYAKLRVHKELSDPRVFHTHRLYFQSIADQYAFARHDARDLSGIKDHELGPLHAYVTSRKNIDNFLKKVPKQRNHPALTYDFYKRTVKDLLEDNIYSYYFSEEVEKFRFRHIENKFHFLVMNTLYEQAGDNGPDQYSDKIPEENKANLRNLWVRTHSSIIDAIINDKNFGLLLDFNNISLDVSQRNISKFFGISYKLSESCTVKPSNKNQFQMLLNRQKGEVLNVKISDERESLFYPNIFKYITKRTLREPHLIVCDYSYEKHLEFHKKLSAFLNKTNFLLNRNTVVWLEKQPINVIVDSFIFKAYLTNFLASNYFNEKKDILLSQFDSVEEYYRFISYINYRSPEIMKNSIHQFKRILIREKFVQRMKENGLDFTNAIPPIARGEVFGRTDVYEDPLFRSVIKAYMPYAVQPSGKLLVEETPSDFKRMKTFLKTYPEEKKVEVRKWYANEISKRMSAYVSDPDKFSESNYDKKIGNELAKGFVGTGVTLLLSNLMITITIINLIIMVLGPVLKHFKYLAVSFLISILVLPPMFTKNTYLYENLPSKSNPRIVNLANYTANNQVIYDLIFPDVVKPNGFYSILKKINSKEERLLFVF